MINEQLIYSHYKMSECDALFVVAILALVIVLGFGTYVVYQIRKDKKLQLIEKSLQHI